MFVNVGGQGLGYMMSFKVKLFSLEHEWSILEKIGLIIAKEGESYANLWVRLEDADVIDWPFLFWDVENKVRINVKLEKLNTILPKMYAILVESQANDVCKHHWVGGESFVFEASPFEAIEIKGFTCQNATVEYIPTNVVACSRVSLLESKSSLKSI